MVEVDRGSLVQLEYDILLDSGEQFDSSTVSGPLWLRVGEGNALRRFGERLIGLHEGDERLINLMPPEVFGDWDPGAVFTLQEPALAESLPERDAVNVRVETEDGSWASCRVYRIAEDRVALDFNHPMAGRPVTVFVRVLRVLSGQVETPVA